ncbi:hypothetical protein PTKIN_Ptkin01aG0243900 [Pterospermum kingtungense]
MKDLEEDDDDNEEMDMNEVVVEDKENIMPTMKENVEKENMNVPMKSKVGNCRQKNTSLLEIDISTFQKPE